MTGTQRAFVFDMDGTIVDNMDFHTQSWVEFMRRHDKQIDPEEFFRETAGRQGKEIIRKYLGQDFSDDEVAAMNREKEEIYRQMYEPHRKEVEGFTHFVEQAKQRGVMLAVATAGPPGNIAFVLDGLQLRQHFHVVVGAADVPRGKPNPDVFLKAAEKLGVRAEDCIVFEDAPLGVEAARNAGMPAVVLSTTLGADAFAKYDNVIATAADFTELSVDDLLAAAPQQ